MQLHFSHMKRLATDRHKQKHNAGQSEMTENMKIVQNLTSSTFWLVLALVSKNRTPFSSASCNSESEHCQKSFKFLFSRGWRQRQRLLVRKDNHGAVLSHKLKSKRNHKTNWQCSVCTGGKQMWLGKQASDQQWTRTSGNHWNSIYD